MDCLHTDCIPTSVHFPLPLNPCLRFSSAPTFAKQGMMDCLYADCTPMITDCVMAELEKLGQKYRVALKIAKVRGATDCRVAGWVAAAGKGRTGEWGPEAPGGAQYTTGRSNGQLAGAGWASCSPPNPHPSTTPTDSPCGHLQDPRVERLPCTHKGTYADDCLCERVKQHRCYIVATCDRDLRRRIRKIPGVPIMYIQSHKWVNF